MYKYILGWLTIHTKKHSCGHDSLKILDFFASLTIFRITNTKHKFQVQTIFHK